jgi:ubiquinol-cytochrome c reductase cytochrome b subunit
MTPPSEPGAPPNWLEQRLPIGRILRDTLIFAPVPADFSLGACFEPLIWGALITLTFTGIWLGLFYHAAPHGAFTSLQTIMRAVPFGWLIRDLHRTGVSILFALAYLQLFRALRLGLYRDGRELAWIVSIVRFATFLFLGVLGFIMIDGAASVALSLDLAAHLAAIPLIGPAIAQAFLGAASGLSSPDLTRPDLTRIAMAHIAIGFLLLLIAGLTSLTQRLAPPANRDGLPRLDPRDLVAFHPHASPRLFAAAIITGLIFFGLILAAPHVQSSRLNAIAAGTLALPLHLDLPWYLLGFAGLAQAGQSLGGGTALIAVLLILLAALPWLDRSPAAAARYRPWHRRALWLLASAWILLSIGAADHAGAWPLITDLSAFYVMAHFCLVTPLISLLEKPKPVPIRLRGAKN